MLFRKKPALYLEFLDSRIRYLIVDSQSKAVLEQAELRFDTEIIHEGKIINATLIENRLHALIAEKKLKNAKASILLPDDFVMIREEKVPAQLYAAEVKDYLALHIGHHIRSPFKETSFHHEILETDADEQAVLLMLYPTAIIKEYEALLANVTLKPDAADISALSLYRILMQKHHLEPETNRHFLVLQWTPGKNSLMVFNRNMPKFARHSHNANDRDMWELTTEGEWVWQHGQEAFDEGVKSTLDVLERFLEFYRYTVMNGKGGITDIILSGDFTYLDDLRGHLEDRFFLPIHCLRETIAIEPKFLPLYGLTLREKTAKKPQVRKKLTKREEVPSV